MAKLEITPVTVPPAVNVFTCTAGKTRNRFVHWYIQSSIYMYMYMWTITKSCTCANGYVYKSTFKKVSMTDPFIIRYMKL